ncbi:TPA: hypothetical protein RVF99_003678, partial [Escherichia coli]|nr:hypothetical protein [Escherichia coli]HCO1547503.1 hypothetical protein [Escherichia coli]HEA2011932.1 hypothetical protein [Escherichia coli]
FSFSSIAELYMTVNIGDENKTTAYNSIEDNYYLTLHSEQVTASSESSGGTASPSAQGKLTLFDPLTNNILNNDIEATLQLIYRVKNRDTGTIVADRRPFIDSRGYLSSSVSPWSEDQGNYETIAECTLDLGKYTHYVGEFQVSGTIKHFVRYTGQNQSGLSTKDISCQVEGTISFNQPASITLSKNIINVQCIRGGNCVTEPIQHIISGTGALSLIIDGDGPLVIQSNGNSFQVTPGQRIELGMAQSGTITYIIQEKPSLTLPQQYRIVYQLESI